MGIIHISIAEIIAFLTLMIAILSTWMAFRIKVQKIETTQHLKFLELEKQISDTNNRQNEWVNGIKEMITQFLADNKAEHKDIAHDVKNIRQSINTVNIRLAGFRQHECITINNNEHEKND